MSEHAPARGEAASRAPRDDARSRAPRDDARSRAPRDDARSRAPRDDVDAVVDAWRRERPDLDTTPLEVLSRVTRLALHLDRARRAAFAAFDLEPWEFDVLAALRRAGGPHELSPSALTAATLVTSGTMTNRIDRLVQRGLVERRADPVDRRGVLVRLTTAGAAAVDAALADLLARERAVLAVLSPAQVASLAHQLRDLLVPFEG